MEQEGSLQQRKGAVLVLCWARRKALVDLFPLAQLLEQSLWEREGGGDAPARRWAGSTSP